VVYALTLYLSETTPHAISELLLPAELKGGPFTEIRMAHSTGRDESPEIQFRVPDPLPAADQQRMRKIFDALPVKTPKQFETFETFETVWIAPHATFNVTEAGTLEVASCEAK
jgi:hypothetical protein